MAMSTSLLLSGRFAKAISARHGTTVVAVDIPYIVAGSLIHAFPAAYA